MVGMRTRYVDVRRLTKKKYWNISGIEGK